MVTFNMQFEKLLVVLIFFKLKLRTEVKS